MAFTPEQKRAWKKRPDVREREREYARQWKAQRREKDLAAGLYNAPCGNCGASFRKREMHNRVCVACSALIKAERSTSTRPCRICQAEIEARRKICDGCMNEAENEWKETYRENYRERLRTEPVFSAIVREKRKIHTKKYKLKLRTDPERKSHMKMMKRNRRRKAQEFLDLTRLATIKQALQTTVIQPKVHINGCLAVHDIVCICCGAREGSRGPRATICRSCTKTRKNALYRGNSKENWERIKAFPENLLIERFRIMTAHWARRGYTPRRLNDITSIVSTAIAFACTRRSA